MERSSVVRVLMALVSIMFGLYMTATVSAVEARNDLLNTDFSGVMQLSAVAGAMLAAGLLALTIQKDRLWISIIELILYGFAELSSMAGLDSEVLRHSPVSLLWLLMVWVVACFVYYLLRMRTQWQQAGQEIVHEHNARLARAKARNRSANSGKEDLPEWDDTTLPPPRL